MDRPPGALPRPKARRARTRRASPTPFRRRNSSQPNSPSTPTVTVCLLTYGNHPRLAQRALDSLQRFCPRSACRILVGANAVSPETHAILHDHVRAGTIDQLLASPVNLDKCPMMRRMFGAVETDLVWWFDDDSYLIAPGALEAWLAAVRGSTPSTVQWGQLASCTAPSDFTDLDNPLPFVRSAAWYRGLPPPSWRPGGKGVFNFSGTPQGDGRWFFILGGCWMMRASALRQLDWPDPRLVRLGDDVFLGEAIRQQGWEVGNIGTPGVALNTEPRRAPAPHPHSLAQIPFPS